MTQVSKYELLLLTFCGAIMAQSGCNREEALRRISMLMAITEEKLQIKAAL